MGSKEAAWRIAIGLAMGGAVAVIAIAAPTVLGLAKDTWVPASFVTHSLMLSISVLLMAALSRGGLTCYGFTRGSFRPTPAILLWTVPTSVLSVLQYVAAKSGGAPSGIFSFSPLQTILFVWIYASICEEVFVRGLLQGFLLPLGTHRVTFLRRWPLSIPVIFGGLFFGAMHVVLWPRMGPQAIVPMTLATILGLVAGHYREKTGSLAPAIVIHALFNIGGSLPGWVLTVLLG